MITSTHRLGMTHLENAVLSIDECISPKSDLHRDHVQKNLRQGFIAVSAHCHCCRDDTNYKTICIPKWGIFTITHEISDLFWHEYGHFLDTRKFTCKSINSKFKNSEDFADYVHNITFQKIMNKLGKSHINGRYVNLKYDQISSDW